MMPRFLLSGHLNLYLPMQNPAAFTIILSTPRKLTAHHTTTPNTGTHRHLHTPTQANTPTVATLFFSLRLTTSQSWFWWCWQHDKTPQHAMKINTHHPTTAQNTNTLTLMLVISEFQFTFLLEVCSNPIIYFSMIYATISSFLSANSRVIFTPSSSMD